MAWSCWPPLPGLSDHSGWSRTMSVAAAEVFTNLKAHRVGVLVEVKGAAMVRNPSTNNCAQRSTPTFAAPPASASTPASEPTP
jgi:hypothetical protein